MPRNGNRSRLFGVMKVAVTAVGSYVIPAIPFNDADCFPNLGRHGYDAAGAGTSTSTAA